jgi:HNH endonuclease
MSFKSGGIMEKYKEYNGNKFRLNAQGYYVRLISILLHRDVWEYHYGKIPEGYQIHHKDGDKLNNEIENLECIEHSEHVKKHWDENKDYLTEKVRKNIKTAQRWRSTNEGKKYYSKHSKDVWKNSPKHYRKCVNCKKDYECYERALSKFCSRKCAHKHSFRTKREQRNCSICGVAFNAYKYNRTSTCGRSCRLMKFNQTRKENGISSKQRYS